MKKRPRPVASAATAAGMHNGAGSSTAQSVPTGRRVLRPLVFGEFFAGSCRLSRAMRQKGCDVFSIEINSAAVEGSYCDDPSLIVMDMRKINPATLPRMDAAHFSPPCTSTTRLRRKDLCGHEPRGPDNEWWGDEDDEKSTDLNEYLDLIIRIIKDQRSRPGNADFVFTVEQPAGGNYPESLMAELTRPESHRQGCGATRLELCYCHFLGGLFELEADREPPDFCCKPTFIWTNARSLQDAWSQGQMFCAIPSLALSARGLPRCHPCEWSGRHLKKGSVRNAEGTARTTGRAASFPFEFVLAYSQLMMQTIGVRRCEVETYARSDQTVVASKEEHSVAAFCHNTRRWQQEER